MKGTIFGDGIGFKLISLFDGFADFVLFECLDEVVMFVGFAYIGFELNGKQAWNLEAQLGAASTAVLLMQAVVLAMRWVSYLVKSIRLGQQTMMEKGVPQMLDALLQL